MALGYALGQIPLVLWVRNAIATSNVRTSDVNQFWATLDFDVIGLDPAVGLPMLLIGHFSAGAILLLCTRYVHQRPTMSLFTGANALRWGRVFWAFFIWIGLNTVVEVIMYAIDPQSYALDLQVSSWLRLLPVILIGIPVQTTVEELLFRGYLLPRLVLGTRSMIMGVLVSSAAFMAIHLGNPEVKEFGIAVMVIYYAIVAVFLSVITLVDNGLELAMGIHMATNIYGAGFVTFEGSVLQTHAPITVLDLHAPTMTAAFVIMVFAFYWLAKWKYRFNDVSSLLNSQSKLIDIEILD